MPKSAAESHINSLDGLRGLAIIMVLLYHGLRFKGDLPFLKALNSVFNCGWTGVDLFFVLSGFLITGILLKARHAENFFSVFYIRRTLRIFPVYYLALFLVFLVLVPLAHHSAFFALHTKEHPSSLQVVLYLLNTSNFYSAFYPKASPYLSHFWSLAIEEHFYALWPLIVWRTQPKNLLRVVMIGILVCIGLKNLPIVLAWNQRWFDFIYRLTPFRIDSLLLGGMLAILISRHSIPERAVRYMPAGFFFFVATFFTGIRFTNPDTQFIQRFGYTLLALAFCCVVILCVTPGTRTSRFFSFRVFRVFGRYSYFLYVFHPILVPYIAIPFAYLARHYMPHFAQTNMWMLISTLIYYSIVFLLAMLSFRYLESPILAYKKHFQYSYPGVSQSLPDLKPASQIGEAISSSR